jgi:hypothetical protein
VASAKAPPTATSENGYLIGDFERRLREINRGLIASSPTRLETDASGKVWRVVSLPRQFVAPDNEERRSSDVFAL